MKLPQTGGCHCGSLRYEITQAPYMICTCHCTNCQRFTSSAFSIGMIVDEQVFHLTGIEPRAMLHTADSGPPQLDEVGMSTMRLMDMQRRKAWIAKPQHISRRARRNLG